MTNSLRVALGLLGFSIFGLVVSDQQVYTRLSYLWGLLIVGSWLWSQLILRGITFKRTPNMKRGQIGEIFSEIFELYNHQRFPRLWLELKDHSPLPGSQGSRVYVMMGGNQGRSNMGRPRLVKRGAFPLGPTTLKGADPFGLFPVSREFPDTDHLLVFPKLVDIERFPGPPGMLPGGEALRRRTHQITPNASNIREYATGDSLSRIHWKSTARRDTLMVKEFELDPMAEIWIFVDGEKDAQAGKPYTPKASVEGIYSQGEEKFQLAPETEEYTATIAASVARYFIKNGREVGLAINNYTSKVLSPDKTGRQLDKILEAMALLRSEGVVPFSAMLTNQCRHLSRGSTVILVTPSVQHDITLAVDQITRLGLRPIVVLINAESFGGDPGTDILAKSISHFGVPVGVISYQDDIGAMLSMIGTQN